MKNTSKKLIALLVILLTVATTTLFVEKLVKVETNTNLKTYYIEIKDLTQNEPIILLEKKQFQTDKEYLAQALNEIANQIELEYEETAYGMTIHGLMGQKDDWNNGPWWVFDINENSSVTGASETVITDGDKYTFNLINF